MTKIATAFLQLFASIGGISSIKVAINLDISKMHLPYGIDEAIGSLTALLMVKYEDA